MSLVATLTDALTEALAAALREEGDEAYVVAYDELAARLGPAGTDLLVEATLARPRPLASPELRELRLPGAGCLAE